MAIGLALMVALGPNVRFGYFVYALGLAGWTLLTRPGLLADLLGSDPAIVSAHEMGADRDTNDVVIK